MQEKNEDSNAKRLKRPQYGLKSLLVLMLIIGIAVGMWSAFIQPFRNQADAINVLSDLDAQIGFTSAEGPGWQRWLIERTVGKNAFVKVVSVDLRGTGATDSTFAVLRHTPHLHELFVEKVPITDSAMLNLIGCREIKELSMRYTAVTDETLRILGRLSKLERIHLTGTKVSDEGLQELQELKSLNELFVRWTQVTEPGVLQLREALPQCKIYF